MPDLTIVDLTIAYPGTAHAPKYWPEDFVTFSIWFKQVPPPSIHLHVRQYSVRMDVPLGKLDGTDGTEEEKKVFDEWLRARWTEKDALMASFARDGTFTGTKEAGRQEDEAVWPLKLNSRLDYLECFSWFLPVIALVGAWYLLPSLWSYAAALGGSAVAVEQVVKPCCAAKAAAASASAEALKLAGGAVGRAEL